MTPAQFRKLALALPGAEEASHMDHPDFRASGKIFAGLTRGEQVATLKLTPEVQATVLGTEGFTAAAGSWGQKGWTQVELASVTVAIMKPLLAEAHGLVARPAKPKAKPKPKR